MKCNWQSMIAGYALTVVNGTAFSTKDKDKDTSGAKHCAQLHRGGFWYNNCMKANPTGMYYQSKFKLTRESNSRYLCMTYYRLLCNVYTGYIV